jgi:hypothetical protein
MGIDESIVVASGNSDQDESRGGLSYPNRLEYL